MSRLLIELYQSLTTKNKIGYFLLVSLFAAINLYVFNMEDKGHRAALGGIFLGLYFSIGVLGIVTLIMYLIGDKNE